MRLFPSLSNHCDIKDLSHEVPIKSEIRISEPFCSLLVPWLMYKEQHKKSFWRYINYTRAVSLCSFFFTHLINMLCRPHSVKEMLIHPEICSTQSRHMHKLHPGSLDLTGHVMLVKLTDKQKIRRVTACAFSNIINRPLLIWKTSQCA